MNALADRSLKRSFNTVFAFVLIVCGSCFAGARSVPLATGGQSGSLTYSGMVLHTFNNSPDGANPETGLVADSSGNLYGTTVGGGTNDPGIGEVFKLTPDGKGGWTYNEIYSVVGGIGLTIDTQGNLYVPINIAPGAIIELSPGGSDGTWVETHSYGFTGGPDGAIPSASVVVDTNGNVYGTTLNGADGCGTVFKLIPVLDQWQEQTLYTFTQCDPQDPKSSLDGEYPQGLIMDRAGDLYGTTALGGTGYLGLIFRLHATADGWKETVLHNFQGYANDGSNPNGNLALDREGNLYGTTFFGFGTQTVQGFGGVYKLTPTGEITWPYVFPGGADGGIWPGGGRPQTGLAFDRDGNLYGTSTGGSSSCGCGIVYELTPPRTGTTWAESVLYNFTGGSDGDGPALATPTFDQAGNIYVTATYGGVSYYTTGFGTVLELKPNPDPTAVTITKNAPSSAATGKAVTVVLLFTGGDQSATNPPER